ncbi:MAG: prepilin peptidase [Alphaproteobacteria bacterium]|nr:prepilin peptidase [Alphaproteobacteria bacterium]
MIDAAAALILAGFTVAPVAAGLLAVTLPAAIERDEERECREALDLPLAAEHRPPPSSLRCAGCGAWNSPSWWLPLAGAGRCGTCGVRRPHRRRSAEIAVMVGTTATALAAPADALPFLLVATWLLALLAVIDFEAWLLPDVLVLPLLWLGLLVSVSGPIVPADQAILGAAAGWGIGAGLRWGFRLVVHRDGMGGGDVKLLAALGAWAGPALCPAILVAASLLGLAAAAMRGLPRAMPFGPFLALAGWASILWREQALALLYALLGG